MIAIRYTHHQLPAAIAQVGGKKQPIGATDLDVAITNQCRLTAGIIIAYNSILLSTLLERYRAARDRKAIMPLRTISPVAWRHVHLHGRYLFRGNRQPIDLVSCPRSSLPPDTHNILDKQGNQSY